MIEDYGYTEELSRKLTRKVGLPVDIVVLNYTKNSILNKALLRGRPLVIKNPMVYYGLKMLAVEQKRSLDNFFNG